MGEATFLGMLKGFPSHLVGFVSSGTGFAGISGSGTILILQSIGLSNKFIFLLVAPTIVVYLACGTWLISQRNKYEYIPPSPSSDPSELSQNDLMEEDQINKSEISVSPN